MQFRSQKLRAKLCPAQFRSRGWMIAVAASPAAQLVIPVSPVLLAVIAVAFLLWVAGLTAVVLHRCREPWRDDGQPVFQRLPDGRVRFSWGVAAQLAAAQRHVAAECSEPDTGPPGARAVPALRRTSTPHPGREDGHGRSR